MNSIWTFVAVCLLSLGINASQEVFVYYSSSHTPLYPQPQPQPQPYPNPAPLPGPGRGKECGINKECVPHFLCDVEGTVVRDGSATVNGTPIIDIRQSEDDVCKYLEECCNTGNSVSSKANLFIEFALLTESKYPSKPNDWNEGCGYRNPDGVGFQITGNNEGEAQFGEFPWMVAILRKDVTLTSYKCGGSVIAPNVVLTAAHCVRKFRPHVMWVRAGEWDTQTTQEVLKHQDVRVKEIISHENHNMGTLYNDVALLILETPFNWQPNVRPICLPEANAYFDYARCYVTGWGKDKFGKDGIYQSILKKIDLPVVPRDTCQANLQRARQDNYYILDRSFMCAGGERGKDVCKGDGGSPLVCPDPQNPQRYYQAGIVAFGMGCGEENIPGVYANVPYLRNWINQKLSARGIDFKYFTV